MQVGVSCSQAYQVCRTERFSFARMRCTFFLHVFPANVMLKSLRHPDMVSLWRFGLKINELRAISSGRFGVLIFLLQSLSFFSWSSFGSAAQLAVPYTQLGPVIAGRVAVAAVARPSAIFPRSSDGSSPPPSAASLRRSRSSRSDSCRPR